MLGALRPIAHVVQADINRLRRRAVTVAVCYSAAALMFAAAATLGGAAAVIALIERSGPIPGLLIGAGLLALAGLIALAVNMLLAARARRRKLQAAAIRDTAIASSLAAGAGKVGDATPMLLPVAALLAFALTNTALGRSRGDG